MEHEVIIAGFGGQGILLSGVVLAYAAMEEGKYISWLPSYGPEMRGGTANCMVVISDEPVASPYVSRPDTVIAMNQPSLEKFGAWLKEGGLMIYNSSAASKPLMKKAARYIGVPCVELAVKAGSAVAANMVALGAYISLVRPVSLDAAVRAIAKALPERRRHLAAVDAEAMKAGSEFAASLSGAVAGTPSASGVSVGGEMPGWNVRGESSPSRK